MKAARYCLCAIIATTTSASAQIMQDNETIQEMLAKLERAVVKPVAQPTKDYAVNALKNSIKAYCIAHNLSFEQCSQKQSKDMQAWFKKQATLRESTAPSLQGKPKKE